MNPLVHVWTQFFQWLTVSKFELTVRGKQRLGDQSGDLQAESALSAETHLKELVVSSEVNEDVTDDSGLNF